MTPDQFAGWKMLLEAKNRCVTVATMRTAIDKSGMQIIEDEPHCGYYRATAQKGGPLLPVAIFRQGDELHVLRGGRAVELEKVWPYCAWNPISYQDYIAVAERGEPWPDEAEGAAPPAPGHNQGPTDEAEVLKEQIKSALGSLSDYSKIASDEQQARAQSLRARLNELSGAADKNREAEKKPHLEAGKAVDAKWQPLVKSAKAGADQIAKAMNAWETEKLREEQATRAKAEAERRAVEEANRKAAEEAAAANKPAPEPIKMPEPEPVAPAASTAIKGAYGRAATVKMVKVVTEVTEWAALYGFLSAHPELRDLMTKLAQRAVDKGHDVPGVRVEEQRKVV